MVVPSRGQLAAGKRQGAAIFRQTVPLTATRSICILSPSPNLCPEVWWPQAARQAFGFSAQKENSHACIDPCGALSPAVSARPLCACTAASERIRLGASGPEDKLEIHRGKNVERPGSIASGPLANVRFPSERGTDRRNENRKFVKSTAAASIGPQHVVFTRVHQTPIRTQVEVCPRDVRRRYARSRRYA
jgi:hypothetical protein